MSGGVDSSVAAGLLAREGHEVIGVTLKLLPRGGEGFGCCGSPEDVMLAKRSADKIGIPHYVLDYSPDFEKNVIDYFVNSYIAGETPNPCLACNRHIKFDKLKIFAQSIEATHLATGHYARVVSESGPEGMAHRLFEAVDPSKDQSYVLYNLNQPTLASTHFPVGHHRKPEIRTLAREMGLPNADKKDSQEICFVPNKDYQSFIRLRIKDKPQTGIFTMTPGPIKNSSGQTLGEHQGVAYYTIGQRRGLHLNASGSLYVTNIEASTNTLVVGSEEDGLSSGLTARDISWTQGRPPDERFEALVKIRYKHEPAAAQIQVTDDGVRVLFKHPQKAVTPGQAAVFYRWNEKIKAREVIGGGKIISALSSP